MTARYRTALVDSDHGNIPSGWCADIASLNIVIYFELEGAWEFLRPISGRSFYVRVRTTSDCIDIHPTEGTTHFNGQRTRSGRVMWTGIGQTGGDKDRINLGPTRGAELVVL